MDNQLLLQRRVEFEQEKKIENHEDRLDAIEYALYKSEKTDTRFDKIYEKLNFLSENRVKDNETNKNMKKDMEARLSETIFNVNSEIKALEVFKEKYDSLVTRCNELCQQTKTYMD